jgi:hypothetical protein
MGSLKNIVVWILISSAVFGAKVTHEYWGKGETFSHYLTSRGISTGLLNDISETDIRFFSEIEGNQLFYELRDSEGVLEQALIPISDEMQIRLARDRGSEKVGEARTRAACDSCPHEVGRELGESEIEHLGDDLLGDLGR